jgi:hypothetical protein
MITTGASEFADDIALHSYGLDAVPRLPAKSLLVNTVGKYLDWSGLYHDSMSTYPTMISANIFATGLLVATASLTGSQYHPFSAPPRTRHTNIYVVLFYELESL